MFRIVILPSNGATTCPKETSWARTLTKYVEYNGQSGAGGHASGVHSGEAIEIAGSTWKRASRLSVVTRIATRTTK
jgi:hypothetical protein